MQNLSEFLLHTTDARFPYASTVGGPCRNKMPRDTMSLQVCCFGCKVLQVIGQLGGSSKSSGSTNEVGTIVNVNVLWEFSSVDETLKAQHEGSCAEVFCAIYVHCFGAHTNKEAGISFD